YADMPGGLVHHAYLFADGVTTDLGTLGGDSEAVALNDSDVVVGRSRIGSGTVEHAFRYENGAMLDLGTLGGPSSAALGVHSNGDVVGWADTAAEGPHAFIWRNGSMTDLNDLIRPGTGWVLQAATGIDPGSGVNPGGAIVGYGQHDGQQRGFFL